MPEKQASGGQPAGNSAQEPSDFDAIAHFMSRLGAGEQPQPTKARKKEDASRDDQEPQGGQPNGANAATEGEDAEDEDARLQQDAQGSSEEGDEAENNVDDENDDEDSGVVTIDGVEYDKQTLKLALTKVSAADAMEADYRRKTAWLARHKREFEATARVNTNTMGSMLEAAKAELTRAVGAVNLQDLQINNPKQFAEEQARLRSMATSVASFENAFTNHKQSVERSLKERDEALVSASMDVLSSVYGEKEWPERYKSLRDFAIKQKLYDAEEFDQVTDWRVMLGLDAMRERSQARETLKQTLKPKGTEGALGKPNAPVSRPRNVANNRSVSGRFAAAREVLTEKRGDQDAAIDFFANKLQNERRQKR